MAQCTCTDALTREITARVGGTLDHDNECASNTITAEPVELTKPSRDRGLEGALGATALNSESLEAGLSAIFNN